MVCVSQFCFSYKKSIESVSLGVYLQPLSLVVAMPFGNAHLILIRLIAVLLLIAFGAKSFGLVFDDLLPLKIGVSRSLLIFALLCELSLAVWNFVRSADPWLRWQVNLIVFSVFLLFSIWRWFAGYASCGCLGVFGLSPLFMIAGDALILLLLTCFKPPISRIEEPVSVDPVGDRWTSRRAWLISALMFGGVVFIGVSFQEWSQVADGPVKGVLLLESQLVANVENSVMVYVINSSSLPVKIVGVQA